MAGPSSNRVVEKYKVNSMIFKMKKIQNQVGREVRVQKVDLRRVEGWINMFKLHCTKFLKIN